MSDYMYKYYPQIIDTENGEMIQVYDEDTPVPNGLFPKTRDGLRDAWQMCHKLKDGDPTKSVVLPGDFD